MVAVCAFCKSTLVREGAKLEDIGKQAELLEDHSPIRLGASGKHRGQDFQVVGRIQYRYGAGLWNEWHVLFGDRKGAWLSDASREYTITYLAPPSAVPAFGELRPGESLTFAGKPFTVLDIESAEVIAGEGELPFKFMSGWKANVADLRGEKNLFATIDYSEEPPHIYVGERLPFAAFAFQGLRDPEAIGFTRGRALAFKCPGCGAPVETHLTTTEVVACGSCGSVCDVTKGTGELVQKNELNLREAAPTIPPGKTGRWQGIDYEVVGYLRRGITVDGERYEWAEYLLHNVAEGYAWLSEYNGHFSFIRSAAELPKRWKPSLMKPQVKYLGRTFTHFQKCEATVTRLAGEFYWRVKVGDEALCEDYIAPPLILSSEKTGNEITWSLGEYVDPAALWKAFRLEGKPPRAIGIAPNQPSPHSGRAGAFWKAFFVFVVVALVAQAGFRMFHSPWKQSFPFQVASGGTSQGVSPPFEMPAGRVTVATTSNVRDTWLELTIKLTEVEHGGGPHLVRRLGYEWVEGAVDGSGIDVAEFPRQHAGRYTVTIDARAGPSAGGTITGNVELRHPAPGWSNFVILAGFLLLWPIAAWWRSVAFEWNRWKESDYAISTGSDDD